MKKKIIIPVVIILVLCTSVGALFARNEDVKDRVQKAGKLCDNLILKDKVSESYEEDLTDIKKKTGNIFSLDTGKLISQLEDKLEDEKDNSLDILLKLEKSFDKDYSDLKSDKYSIDESVIKDMDKQKKQYDSYKEKECYKDAYTIICDLQKQCDRGRSEAKEEKDNTEAKEEKKEKKWLTKEEFAKATGLDKEPEEALNDEYYTYKLYSDPDEALEAVKENIAYNKESGGWEQLYGDGNQVVDNSDGTNSQTTTSDNNTSSDVASDQQVESQTNSNQPSNTQDNTSQQQESGISHEEAERIAAEFNHGNTGFQKGLTPEQEQREMEAWSKFSAQ